MLEHKLQMLKFSLQNSHSYSEADEIVKSAEEEIYSEVMDEVREAVDKVVSDADELDADQFLAQIRLSSNSGYIQITTDSGTLDFSLPERQMLNDLLKNAKTSASTGVRYKRINIGGIKKPRPKTPVRDIASGLSNLSQRSLTGVGDMATQMVVAFNAGASGSIMRRREEPQSVRPNEFYTATSDQDPSRSWVIPPRDMDLTGAVNEVNAQLRFKIDAIIDRVISKYSQGS
jgi:hypothetical protein